MCGRGVEKTVMQHDGNLVSYTPEGSPVWASNTYGNGGAYLKVRNDGNVVIYKDTSAIWTTKMHGRYS